MADVARLGIVVDADGAVRQIKLTSEELKRLANEGTKARDVMSKVAPAKVAQDIQRTTQSIQQAQIATRTFNSAGPGVAKLQNAFGNLAVAAAGIPGPVGRVASTLGQFAIGGAVTVAVLAGIAALTFAWRKFREEAVRAEEAMKKVREGALSGTEAAMRARLAIYQQREANLANGREATGGRAIDLSLVGVNARKKLLEETRDIIAQLGQSLAAIDRAKASEEMERFAAAAERSAEAAARMEGRLADGLDFAIRAYAKSLADAHDEAERFKEAFAGPTGAFGGVTQGDIQNVIESVQKLLDELTEMEKKAKQLQAIRIGAGLGGIAGIASSAGGAMGVLGGAISGGIGGIAGGPVGVAAGAMNGLIGGLMSLSDSAGRAKEVLRQYRLQFEAFADAQKEALGILSSTEARIRDLKRTYAEMRREIEITIALASARGTSTYNPALAEEYKKKLVELNALERDRIAQLAQELVALNKVMQEDLEVRRLRALGRTEEADAMALALEQERELAQARKDGADALTLAALAEVQRVEKLNISMSKVQARIDSLTNTITGLASFRDALKLSGTESPTDRLAEARRQYASVLVAAQGDGDAAQAAAGRLPGAAQTLLDLSRLVNASGADFQADFKKVLEDTNALIQQFADRRSVEELMLEELRRIRDGVEESVTLQRPRNTTGGVVGNRPLWSEGGADIAVLQEGFTQLIDRVDALATAVADSARETRRAVTALI